MKQLLLNTAFFFLFLQTNYSQEFANKRVLINDLGASIGNNDIQNVEDVVYAKVLNGQLHFLAHIDEVLTLYKFENDQVIEIGNIGELSGFVVDAFDHDGDNLSDILGHFQIKLGVSETEFADQSNPATAPLEGRIYRAADYNNDGIVDILSRDLTFSGGAFTETIHVYYLNDDQSIQSNDSFFSSSELKGAQAFDLNQDGLTDFAYIQDIFGGNRLIIQMNNGNGSYTEQDISVSNPESLISANDVDNDGDLDIIITGFNGNDLNVLVNESGSFSNAQKIVDTGRIFSIKTADMNNDLNPDLIYLENESFDSLKASILISNGDGTFGAPKTVGKVQFEGVSFTNSFEQAAEDWLTIYDYNEDGNLDVFVNAILEQSFVVFENRGVISSAKQELLDKKIEVYPNPSSGQFVINNIELPSAVTLIDMNGYVHPIRSDNNRLDISNLNAGLYFLRIKSKDNEIHNIKIVKK